MPHDTPSDRQAASGHTRPWLAACGWLLFALGVVGIALPLMPTTVFWIGAAWCWMRSAPRLTKRILSHPRFGHPVRRFLERGEMTRQGKLAATGGMLGGYALFHLIAAPSLSLGLLLAAILSGVALWLWRRPEPVAKSNRLASDS